LKRQYLGLFWEAFHVEDKEIVKAVPSQLIRELQQESLVRLSAKRRASPPLNLTLRDPAYLKSIREKLLTIKALQLQERRQLQSWHRRPTHGQILECDR
jgi:hypothetical protein